MSKKYLVFGSDNLIAQRLVDSISAIPKDAVEVTDEVWLATSVENDGVWMRAADGSIIKQALPEVTPDYAAWIAAERFRREVAGVKWDDFIIATDRESRSLLDQERSAGLSGLRSDGRGWKCFALSTGTVAFRPTTNAEILEISAAVYRYVAECFQRESDLLDLVAKGVFEEHLLQEGWPNSAD